MSRVKAFGLFWWEFIIGDDWLSAAGIAAAIGTTAVIAAANIAAWWVLPLTFIAVLYGSLRRATR